MNKILTLVCNLFFIIVANAQLGIDIQNSPYYLMNCADSCITLHANYPKPLKTNLYNVVSIPFAPALIAGQTINLSDDKFSGAIPIGFDFCFFNNVYNQCYISDNGMLTFNPAYANGNCNNNTQQTLPYFNSTFPDNAIFFPFLDINPNLGGTMRYATIGTAPYRKFVVHFQNVKLFGNSCANVNNNFQLVLHETYHYIDVFILSKSTCDNDPTNHANYATVGIQNISATSVYTAPGKHASVFTASNEGIRFAPAGPPDYTVEWKDRYGFTIAVNVDSVVICPTEPFPYQYVTAKLQIFCPSNIWIDSIILDKTIPLITNIQLIHPFCLHDSNGAVLVNANVANPPPQYAINNGPYQLGNVFTGLSAGFHTIKVKDANGCYKDTTIELIPQNVFNIIIDSFKNPVCPDTVGWVSIHATGTVGPYTIQWSNGQFGNLCTNIGLGGVIATITDGNGCVQLFPYFVTQDSIPEIQLIYNKPKCGDSSGNITAIVTNGKPPYTLLWNTGDTTYTISNLATGNYSVMVTDSVGCNAFASLNLIDTLTTLTYKSTVHTKCGLNNGSAAITAANGLPPYTYAWLPGGQNTATITGLAPGTYYCTTMDANNCMKKDTFVINSSVGNFNQLTYTNANCDTSNGIIYLNGVQNATGNVTIQWSTGQMGGNLLSGIDSGKYWIKTTDSKGCIAIDTIHIFNDGKPILHILSYKEPLCHGMATGEAVLGGSKGTAPYKYSLDGITFSSNANLYNILAGVYTIYISDANSCINTTVVTFTEPPLIEINYTADTVICYNDYTSTLTYSAFGGTPGFVYSFNNGIFTSDTIQYQKTQGIYNILVKDKNGCTRPFNIEIPGPKSALDVKFDKKNIYCFEQNTGSFTAKIEGGWQPYIYQWSNGATGMQFDNLPESSYTIFVTDNQGCTIEKEVNIEILKCCKMVVPNAFSPNRDGLNDKIGPIAISDVSAIKFTIYDRWGNMVFHTKKIGDKWDGTIKEIPCDIATYFYILEYTCPLDAKTYVEKGDITLVR